jgi:hypothetical protein
LAGAICKLPSGKRIWTVRKSGTTIQTELYPRREILLECFVSQFVEGLLGRQNLDGHQRTVGKIQGVIIPIAQKVGINTKVGLAFTRAQLKFKLGRNFKIIVIFVNLVAETVYYPRMV